MSDKNHSIRGKQTSKTEVIHASGHQILIERSTNGISLRIVDHTGRGFNDYGTFFPEKTLRNLIKSARDAGEISIELNIKQRSDLKKDKTMSKPIPVRFSCSFLTKHLDRMSIKE